jgi:propionate catabolism operon transcriptional regulator
VPVVPLRERSEDLPFILAEFIGRHGGRRKLSVTTLSTLMLAPWPGNLRQLDAVAERLAVEEGTDPPGWLERALAEDKRDAMEAEEKSSPAKEDRGRSPRPDRATLLGLCTDAEGNLTAVATRLGIGRPTLYRWLRAEGLSPEDVRSLR